MTNLYTKAKRLLNMFLGLFPSKLPTGMAAFDSWAQSIIDTYSMPTQDKPSLLFGLTATIMRLGPTTAYKSKFYFYLILTAGAQKQVASEQFRLVKEGQQAAAAQTEPAPLAHTPPPEAVIARAARNAPTG